MDMYIKFIFLYILVFILPIETAVTRPNCIVIDNSCYGFYSSTATADYEKAKGDCKNLGPNVVLASFKLETTFDAVITNAQLFSGITGSYWLYIKEQTTWRWKEAGSANKITYNRWATGQPSAQKCLAVDPTNSHKWNAMSCTNSYLYLCRDEGYTDNCAIGICQNGGTCASVFAIPSGIGYICTCMVGFTGANCQTNINECASSPCGIGGNCVDGINGYTCTCLPGYTGTHCETDIDECASNPCQNSATCLDQVNGYTCTCVTGYTGVHCQTNIDECASSPCSNGATCVDQVNYFTCTCVPGFTGILCETNINECASSPCQNGATCNDAVNKYTCSCVAGFIGIHCETNVDECASSPCVNSGTCVDGVNGYTCTCLPSWYDTHCESVDGQWGNWTPYSDCPVTCGPGERFRTRACDSPPPDGNGKSCVGVGWMNISCGLPRCPYPCMVPPAIGNGVLSGTPAPSTVFIHATYLTYMCDSGYYINGDARGVYCNDGNWTGILPTCFYFVGKPSEVMNDILWAFVVFALLMVGGAALVLYLLVRFYLKRRKYEKIEEQRLERQQKLYAWKHGLPWPMKNIKYTLTKPITRMERMFNEAMDSNRHRWSTKLYKEPSFVPPPANDPHPWIEPGKPMTVIETHIVTVKKKKKKSSNQSGRTVSPSSVPIALQELDYPLSQPDILNL